MNGFARTTSHFDLSLAHAGTTADAEARAEQLERVRRAVAAGVYMTQDKLEATADVLWHVINTDDTARRRVG